MTKKELIKFIETSFEKDTVFSIKEKSNQPIKSLKKDKSTYITFEQSSKNQKVFI